MKGLIKKLKNKKGFTLIELIVTMAIFMIVMSMVLIIFVPIQNSYNRGQEYVTAKYLAKASVDFIKKSVDKSNKVILSDTPVSKSNGIEMQNMFTTYLGEGNLFNLTLYKKEGNSWNGASVFNEGFYEGYNINIQFMPYRKSDGVGMDVPIVEIVITVKYTVQNEIINLEYSDWVEPKNIETVEILEPNSDNTYRYLIYNLPRGENEPQT